MSSIKINNEEQKTVHIFRISDIANEPLEILPPITRYDKVPIVSLECAVQPLVTLLPCIQSYVELVKQRCKTPPANNLTLDQSASIMLYSLGWKPAKQCLYIALNAVLRSKNRDQLQPWFLYLRLLSSALRRLPSIHQNIYRGIESDVSQKYQIGETFTWWGYSSCTNLTNILQSNQFFNTTTERTLFTIESFTGKDIRQHSCYPFEEEFLLLPGTQFKVESIVNQDNGVHSIRLQEIKTEEQPTESDIELESELTTMSNYPKITFEEDGIFAGIEENGSKLNQLYYPGGIFVDDDETLYIADSRNHRIMEWKFEATEGRVVAGGNDQGDELNQLDWPLDVVLDRNSDSLIISDKDNRRVVRWPRKNGTKGEILISDIDCWGLAIDKNGDLYVADRGRHEVRRWKIGGTRGRLVAGGNGAGDRLDQLDSPAYIHVDENLSVYIADRWNHRVVKWERGAKQGIRVAGSTRGIDLDELSGPLGVIVDEYGTVFVSDCGNNRVMCWFKGAKEGVLGAGGIVDGKPTKQFQFPFALAFNRQGNLYVVDQGSHIIQRFTIHRTFSS